MGLAIGGPDRRATASMPMRGAVRNDCAASRSMTSGFAMPANLRRLTAPHAVDHDGGVSDDDFTTLRYETRARKAYITLDRPDRLNAIDGRMPSEIRRAVERANDDPDVHVIVLGGEGRSFCAGYDLK